MYLKYLLHRQKCHMRCYTLQRIRSMYSSVSRQIDANRIAIGLKSTWIEKFHLSSPETSLVFRESYPE